MPRALALSPHLDDAAFSCGGTLALLAQEGWEVTICTAFTRSVPYPSGFALACQLDKGLPPDVDYMALRRVEDLVACARLGVGTIWLDLPEAPHRGYPDAKSLFLSPHLQDNISVSLAKRLRALLETPPTLLLAPQALGGHVDHVLLVQALRSVLPDGLPVWWWTDFPYAMRTSSHSMRPFAADWDVLSELDVSGDAAARLAACGAYETQIGFQFSGLGGLADALQAVGPVERFRVRGWKDVQPFSAPSVRLRT